MADDALLTHHAMLIAKVAAWVESWNTRGQAPSATVAQLLSHTYMGQPLAAALETRLLEARREIDNQIARYAGTIAAAIALLCRAGDTDAIERSTHEAFLKIGQVEDGFATKMAELQPLVDTYARLSLALKR